MRAPPLALVVVAATLVVLTFGACPIGTPPDDERDGGPDDTGYPPPRTDLTDALGDDDTLEVAAWNLKNFPCGNESFSTVCRDDPAGSVELVTDLIASLALDVLAVEEIADVEAFEEIVQRLPNHEGVLSTDEYFDGTYQKIGVIYDASKLSAGEPVQLFASSDDFPRPAYQLELTWTRSGEPLTFLVIALHLKAGESSDDRGERTRAIAQLEQYVGNLVDGDGQDNIIVLGDFNETLDAAGLPVFQPLRDGARYTIQTQSNHNAGEESFLSSGVILDHIVTTTSLASAIDGAHAVIPRLQRDVDDYRERVSDHLPVALSIGPP
ncbi:MAG: hypothetical protein IT383_04670 [Deltaproteobacteria bacterium]|nr:hypothetical protein [Deltaproteobacteria bacterium]